MSQHDKRQKRYSTSYAGRHPDFSQGTPVSLKKLQPLREPFDQTRDPLYKKQLEALEKTEAQRREETETGSQMVKLHKPFPDLRPRNDQSQIRRTFNQAWLREHRRAAEAYLQQQAQEKSTLEENHTPDKTIAHELSR